MNRPGFRRGWHNDQRRLRGLLDNARHQSQTAGERADRLAAVAGRVTDTRGDRFIMTADGRRWTKRVAAGKHLRDVLAHRLASTPPETTGKPQPVAQLGGLDIHVQATTVIEDELRILIPDVGNEMRLVGSELATIDPSGLIRRIEHPIHRLPDTITDLRWQAEATS